MARTRRPVIPNRPLELAKYSLGELEWLLRRWTSNNEIDDLDGGELREKSLIAGETFERVTENQSAK